MKSKFLKYVIIFNIVFSILLISPARIANSEDPLDILDKKKILDNIAEITRRNYFETVDMNTLYDGAIQGMINKLDPHSSYMPPSTADDFDEKIRGNFQGIGITFSVISDKITVIDVIKNSPSEKAGLKSRDKIVKIDGKNAIGFSTDDVQNRLRGPAKSSVKVHIERPGEDKLLEIKITRDRVAINSVSHSYMIDDTVGYIGLTRFTINTKFDVHRALAKLKSQNMEKLILDLRNNSGGSLDAAIGVVNCFIREGTVVSTKGKRNDEHPWIAERTAQYTREPIIVLINHGSASASEIVAGALQDHDRALIVGQTSFGKGLVMNPFDLQQEGGKDLGKLILTIAQYYTPSKRLIQRPYNGSREDYIKEGFDDYDPNAADADKKDRPVYYTDLGREVYGGGGITPDKILMSDNRINKLEYSLRQANLFFEFADNYLLRNNDLPDDFNEFLFNYYIPDHEIALFKEFIISKDIEIDNTSSFRGELTDLLNKFDIPEKTTEDIEKTLVTMGIDLDETLFNKSRDFIEREIKMEISRMIWGPDERYKVWHASDTDLIGALSYFTEAEELLRERFALGNLLKNE